MVRRLAPEEVPLNLYLSSRTFSEHFQRLCAVSLTDWPPVAA
jgi:hypothetical protein